MIALLKHIVRPLAFILCVATATLAGAAAEDYGMAPEWKETIDTLHRLPVQDTGYVRTGFSFAENLLSAVSGKRSLGKADPMATLLNLMQDPTRATSASIIKISHPDLVSIYGTSHISAMQWREEKYREALMNFLRVDQENRMGQLNSIEYRAQLLENLGEEFAIIPQEGEWLTHNAAHKLQNPTEVQTRILAQWDALQSALEKNDAAAGAAASRELVESVTAAAQDLKTPMPPLRLELFYYGHNPFGKAAVLYLFSALLFGAGLIMGKRALGWGGMALLAVGFVEHAVGITARWILASRGPLSNMYESFVFAIGGMVLVALVLEASKMVRLAGLGASILGFIFMVIAHKAPIFDSQIRPLMPALQSSWLTYHVVTIMLSYSAFALSFFVSALYLSKDFLMGGDGGRSLLARQLPSLRSLDIFNYRIIAVGFPLLTLGIITGAIWAATAWGRPWGFDPKETWSAITWLIYAIYLHIRYMAGWSDRSAAWVSLLGFLCVLFTYLGVNYLLPGLHSYV